MSESEIFWWIFSVPALLLASGVHEWAHAYAAFRLGDPTAKAEGRMTMNPLVHIDPIGLIAILIAKIGWSKPVPVNEYNFEKPVLGMALVAFAGPASNLIVAITLVVVAKLFLLGAGVLPYLLLWGITEALLVAIGVNLSLFVFNLIPLPPLDGYRIARLFLPGSLRYYWDLLERYAVFVILFVFSGLSPLSGLVSSVLDSLYRFAFKIILGATSFI